MYHIKRGNTVVWSGKAQGKQSKVIMQEDRVEITIKTPIPIIFKKGDTIKVYGETYKLNRPENIGKTNNEIGYTFTIEFEALYYDLGKWILNTLDKNNNLTEPDVHIMGEASVILGLLVENANRTSSGWTLGQVDRTETIQWAYNGAKLLTVLQDVADQTNLEFWCVGKQINLTRKQIQTGITFQYGKGKGLYELRRDRKDKPVVTHMKVQGGTQNLPNGYGFRQIQPTGGNPMVNPNYTAGSEVVEDVMTFENVYPRLEAKVTSVQANNMIRSTDIDFNLNDHLLADGTSAQIAFTSGLLNSFKFTISEDGFDNATKQVKFNPITDENAYPDGVPNAMLKPAVGDSFVFLNINMPQSYVTAAENRVKELGDQYFEEEGTEQYTWSGKITPKFILENNIELTLGGIVNLNASDIGFSGPIRIASYTRDLEEEYLYDFTLSNVVTINYLVRLRNQSDRLANAVTKGLSSDGLSNKSTYAESAGFATLAGHANTATNAATANFASQAQNAVNADRAILANRSTFSDHADKAALSDRAINADHADKATLADRATLANYALDADHAKEADHAKLADRANVADYAYDSDKWDGKQFADYIDQPLRTNDIVRHQSISTPAFISGATGSGWKLFADGSAEVDSLTVRKSLNVVQLNIREITGTGGSFAVTNVAKIHSVTEFPDYFSCVINTDDNTLFVPFNAGDIVRCQVWDGKGIKYYVGRIRAVSQSIFDIEKPLLAGSGVPSAGDNVFQFGSSVAGRQGMIYMTNSDSGAPYLDVLDGIDSPSLEGKTKVRLGKLNGITDSVFGALSGYGLYAQNAYLRGNFWVTGGNAETKDGAQEKANNAQSNAVVVAGQDATAKANAAKDFAAAQDNLAKVETKAYADGIVDAEEARAIADAQAKLELAKQDATSKATQARQDAINAAASDATNKANTARTEAIAQANHFATDAINAVAIGGRNLVWHSDVDAYSEAYLIKHYSLTEDIKFGETYTITIWGNIAGDRFFGLWDESSSAHQCVIYKVADGVYRATWVPSEWFGNKKVFSIYQLLNDLGSFVPATINKIKVEKGNKATDWSPAPEDITNSLEAFKTETTQSFVVMDGKIEGKVNKTDFNVLGQTVSQQGSLISQNASSIELRATKQEFSELNNTVGGISGRVSNAETAIQQNSSAISLRAVKSDVDTQVNVVNDRIDNTVTRLSVAELKITPEAIQQTVKSQTESIVSAAVPVTRKQVSTLGLDENTYYPLIIGLSSNDRYKIMIDRMLDVSYGKPAYSFHPAGFSAHVEWTTIGSGWGARQDDREILIAQQRYTEIAFGSIGQINELSQEFIYLRGGSIWDVSVFGSNSVEITIYQNGYHWEAGFYSGDVPLSTFVNEVKSITSRILNSETQISQTKDEIALRATKTEVTTQVNQVATTASQDATAKANAAKGYADAQDALLKAQTDAYADGKVTAEESARIAQSQANLQAAKDYAAAQDALSKIEAKAYADGVVDAEEARAIADAAAKANIAQANAINAASQDATIKSNNAISASNTYTDSQIVITNNAISLKAEKSTVDNINNRLSSAELKITPEAINSIVSGQIDTKANGAYNDAVAYANSQITQTKDAIQLSVDKKIANVQIGGRNLAIGSKVERSATNSSSNENYVPYYYISVELDRQSEYTFSCEMWMTSNVESADMFYVNDYGEHRSETNIKMPLLAWYRRSFTFKTGSEKQTGALRFDNNGSIDGQPSILKVRNVKLEKGNKTTDWTPAPEDTQGQIDAVVNRVNQAELKITDDSIRAVVRQQTENIVNDTVLANLWSSGKPLNPDPTFKDGMNGLDIYNNEGTGAANWGRLPVSSFSETFPTTSGYGLYYAQNGDRPTSPGWGGFHCNTVSRAKAKFLVRMILAFEEGRNINFHSHSFGDEGKQRWLTPTAGKGVNNFTEYISYVECGNTGSFGNTNFFDFAGGNSVSVRIAFVGVYDITDAVNNYTTKQEIASSFEITSGGISIAGKSLSLAGKVTFSSLDANAQQYISDIDTLAYTANGYASNAQSVANIASGAANNALVSAEGAKNTADTAFLTANNAKNTADSANATASSANIMSDNANIAAQNATITANSALSSTSETALVLTTLQAALKGMAFQDKVDISKLDTTIIDGGYVKTTLLNVSEIFAQNITATGTITATNLNVTGNSKVGGFDIQGNKLSSAAPDTSLVFSALLGGSHVEINSSMSSPLISIRTDQAQRRGMSIQTYASEAIGLDIIANAGGRFAITSHGGHQFHQRAGELWNAPGLLLAISINKFSAVSELWNISSLTVNYSSAGSTSANRKHVITHNLGHTDYIVHYTIASPTLGIYMNNPNIATIKLIDKSANSFEILVVGSRSGTSSSNEVYTIPDVVQFLMIGRNRQL